MTETRDKLQFILEIEKLKSVLRKTKPVGLARFENTAEHSWQTTLTALLFLEEAGEDLDALKVLKMLLIHDIVEIDAGDTFVYDQKARKDVEEEELRAARRIFGLLPDPLGKELLELWEEFEGRKSPEAIFAKAMDRVNPVVQNLNSNGQSWVENRIKREQVLKVNSEIQNASPALWHLLKSEIEQAEFFEE